MSDGEPADSIEEKRVFGERGETVELLVAAGIGVVSVSVSDGRVGEFGIEHRCSPRDVAASGRLVAVATEEDVLVGAAFRETEFGPAVAVGFRGGAPLAAAPDGRVARFERAWNDVGALEDEVTAIDGPLVGTDGGVFRLEEGLPYAGLDAVRDVSAAGGPLAATADGLYALGNGWMDAASGDFRVVDSDGERAHAATADGLYERRGGEWRAEDLPTDGAVVGVTYADRPYAVTRDGTLLAREDDGWRANELGVSGVVGVVPR